MKHLRPIENPALTPIGELFHKHIVAGPKVLSDSKELRQVPDTSEGSLEKVATCCGLKNRHEESGDAQKDVCESRHGGNPESQEAFASIRDRLTTRQRQVFEEIRFSKVGLTVDQIAQCLGTTPNAVSGRVVELRIKGLVEKRGRRRTRSGCMASVIVAV